MSQRALQIAQNWLGTPFLEGASQRGAGCDCAGLIEGIARELGLSCPSRQSVDHDVLAAASIFLTPCDDVEAGDLILLARVPHGPPLHAGIVTDTGTIIHAHWSAGVIENRFGAWFTRRVTHIFAWPQTTNLKDI